MGHPFKGVDDAGASGGLHPDVVAAVVSHCRANVEAFACVWGPGGAVFGADVGEDFGAGWGKWRPVEVKLAVELCIGGEVGVDARGAEEIQGDYCLGNEFVPEVEWEGGIDRAKTSNEVVFEGLDGSFGFVSAVEASRGELYVDVVVIDFVD